MPNKSGLISEFLITHYPVIGEYGLRRNLGKKATVNTGTRSYLGILSKNHSGILTEDNNGFYLASLSTQRNLRRIQKGNSVQLPVSGRNGIYIREYYFE